jgi:hypothetical protein
MSPLGQSWTMLAISPAVADRHEEPAVIDMLSCQQEVGAEAGHAERSR